ncbi:hypothetical protein [Sphingosinicella sp. BN140058]|uniref:hypothetical protein n=1 Tax=Sphingosinicella sp. BN140058 TaxID=1892855 RepID=UPI001011CD27|nr:hypothetical protein [Sphingosinicella sp. BN140058]QAY80178.1 hypothetical protein ETR14_26405 [Sphingosinicella sp. BN140058]
MGIQNIRILPCGSDAERARFKTAFLVLILLGEDPHRPRSTYELGLWVADDQLPPRPLSVIMKSLADDRYIVRHAAAGKRSALWLIAQRGIDSLARRDGLRLAARAWLDGNPNYTADELEVMRSLCREPNQHPSRLATSTRLPLSSVRTALRKLQLRCYAAAGAEDATSYRLTAIGKNAVLPGASATRVLSGSFSAQAA